MRQPWLGVDPRWAELTKSVALIGQGMDADERHCRGRARRRNRGRDGVVEAERHDSAAGHGTGSMTTLARPLVLGRLGGHGDRLCGAIQRSRKGPGADQQQGSQYRQGANDRDDAPSAAVESAASRMRAAFGVGPHRRRFWPGAPGLASHLDVRLE
jgi:hypothetical protein